MSFSLGDLGDLVQEGHRPTEVAEDDLTLESQGLESPAGRNLGEKSLRLFWRQRRGAGFTRDAALRGEGKGPITFEADGILIVLDVQPAAEGLVRILGQVAADDQDRWTGASVELRQVGMLQMAATVDDLGAFRFEGVLPGSTEFLITPLSGDAVLVPNVEIVV